MTRTLFKPPAYRKENPTIIQKKPCPDFPKGLQNISESDQCRIWILDNDNVPSQPFKTLDPKNKEDIESVLKDLCSDNAVKNIVIQVYFAKTILDLYDINWSGLKTVWHLYNKNKYHCFDFEEKTKWTYGTFSGPTQSAVVVPLKKAENKTEEKTARVIRFPKKTEHGAEEALLNVETFVEQFDNINLDDIYKELQYAPYMSSIEEFGKIIKYTKTAIPSENMGSKDLIKLIDYINLDSVSEPYTKETLLNYTIDLANFLKIVQRESYDYDKNKQDLCTKSYMKLKNFIKHELTNHELIGLIDILYKNCYLDEYTYIVFLCQKLWPELLYAHEWSAWKTLNSIS